MRALVQRVTEATVRVDGAVVGEIGPGLVILACAMQGDGPDEALALAGRIAKLRIFRDADQRMNLSVTDQGGIGPGHQPVHPCRRHIAREPSGLLTGRGAGTGRRAGRDLWQQNSLASGLRSRGGASAPT